jgi:hypothetical protein
MSNRPKYSQDERYERRSTKAGSRFFRKNPPLSSSQRDVLTGATQGLTGAGGMTDNKVVGWENMTDKQVEMLPLTPMQRHVFNARKLAKKGTIGELAAEVDKISSFHERTVKKVEESGEKPDRNLKRLGRSIKRAKRKINSIQNDEYAKTRYHADYPEPNGVYSKFTDRDITAELTTNMFKHATQVGVVIGEEQPESRYSPDEGWVNADGVRLPSSESYEDAAAILGRGFDSAATEVEMKAYRDAGKEPPQELRDHHNRILHARHPYDDF